MRRKVRLGRGDRRWERWRRQRWGRVPIAYRGKIAWGRPAALPGPGQRRHHRPGRRPRMEAPGNQPANQGRFAFRGGFKHRVFAVDGSRFQRLRSRRKRLRLTCARDRALSQAVGRARPAAGPGPRRPRSPSTPAATRASSAGGRTAEALSRREAGSGCGTGQRSSGARSPGRRCCTPWPPRRS